MNNMNEIAIISTREVLYSAPNQKFGKIKVTLKISQNLNSWNLDVKYFGVEKTTGIRPILKEVGKDENNEPIYENSTEEYEYLQQNLILEKILTKSDEDLNQLFQAVGKTILPDEFPQKFYEIQRDALLMYVQTDLIDSENCIFGIKPTEWEICTE